MTSLVAAHALTWIDFASREVILTAGAIDSPKLLMLSGIGDKVDLQQHGIDVVHHLPGVGENLQDHPFIVLSFEHKDPTKDGRVALMNDPAAMAAAQVQFSKDGTGPLTSVYSALVMGWFKDDSVFSTNEFQKLPFEAQAHFKKPTVPLYELASGLPNFLPGADPAKSYITFAIFASYPQSSGTVKLQSANPADDPICDPACFSNPFDIKAIIAGVRAVFDLVETPSMAKDIQCQFLGPPSRSDQDIITWTQATCITSYHMSCTVKMGTEEDNMACVDSSFRLKGLQGLRVADMSVTPFLPACHTVAPAYIIGDTAADKIIAEYGLAKSQVI